MIEQNNFGPNDEVIAETIAYFEGLWQSYFLERMQNEKNVGQDVLNWNVIIKKKNSYVKIFFLFHDQIKISGATWYLFPNLLVACKRPGTLSFEFEAFARWIIMHRGIVFVIEPIQEGRYFPASRLLKIFFQLYVSSD